MLQKWFPRATRALLGLTALVAVSGVQTVMAQSTIFNIPTTDVVEMKKAYVEFDYLGQAPSPAAPVSRTDIYVPRVVIGAAKNLEAGANFSFARSGGATQSYFQPNAKYKFAENKKSNVAAAGGFIWYVPTNNRTVVSDFGLVYGNLSKKTSGSKSLRLTIGGYRIVGESTSYSGTKGGAIVGLEQAVHPKVSIVGDWFSGVSGLGYLTPGVSITLPHSGLFNAGYSIGNDSLGSTAANPDNRAVFLYYGITLPK